MALPAWLLIVGAGVIVLAGASSQAGEAPKYAFSRSIDTEVRVGNERPWTPPWPIPEGLTGTLRVVVDLRHAISSSNRWYRQQGGGELCDRFEKIIRITDGRIVDDELDRTPCGTQTTGVRILFVQTGDGELQLRFIAESPFFVIDQHPQPGKGYGEDWWEEHGYQELDSFRVLGSVRVDFRPGGRSSVKPRS